MVTDKSENKMAVSPPEAAEASAASSHVTSESNNLATCWQFDPPPKYSPDWWQENDSDGTFSHDVNFEPGALNPEGWVVTWTFSPMEDAGFQIRDEMIWLYTQSRAKAQGMDRFIHKAKGIAAADQAHLRRQLAGWKTPQLRCNHEPICLAQKPLQGTFLANQIKYGVGLVNTSPKVGDGKFVSNVVSTGTVSDEIDRHFLVPKPTKDEKGDYNTHKTVKPLELFRHLILLTTAPGALVLDPFIGSGTTALACRQLGRDFIGMEMNEEYLAIAERRLDDPVPKVRG